MEKLEFNQERFAKKLKEARAEKGWGLNEAARRIDVNPASLCRWEQGERVPLINGFINVCYEKSFEWFL